MSVGVGDVVMARAKKFADWGHVWVLQASLLRWQVHVWEGKEGIRAQVLDVQSELLQ